MPLKTPQKNKAIKVVYASVKNHLLASAFFVLSVMPVQAEVTIIDVRTGLHPDKTRVVLEVSEIAYYRITYRDDNGSGKFKEIIIDLMDTPSRNEVTALVNKAAAIGLLEKITIEDNDGAARLRISLRRAATIYNSFPLKPDHGMQFRQVFDLKAISPAEWARQVLLTEPPKPEPEIVAEAEFIEPTAVIPEAVAPEPQAVETYPETYDDMVTGESNFTLSGFIEVEGRVFPQSSFSPDPKDWTVSFALEPLLEYVSDNGNSQFMFRPFGRIDVNDNDRSHFDIRELKWTGTLDRIQMTVGFDTVFWGVTESNHLVDILNQDDNLEDIDQEDKLGQPMVSVAYDSNFGVFSAYIMSYFREIRFPGQQGRLRPPLPVDYGQTQYQAGSKEWHTDWAVRWSHVIGSVDVGLYHFRGTNREPELLLGADGDGNAVLIPRYNLIGQTGLDLQGTFDDILIKFEGIHRTGSGVDFWAMTGGFEYTFYGLGGGGSDIGVLAEYLYDDRGANASTPFEDDVFVAMRWAANDIDSTQVLVGAIFDLDTSATFLNFEGSRRIGDSWKVTLDARFFLGIPMADPIFLQSRDDFFQIRLARYF